MFPTFLMLLLIQPSSKMWQPPYKLFLLYFLPKEIDFNIAGPIKTSPKLNTFTIHIIDQQNPRNFASLLSRSWTSVLTRQSSLYMQLIPHTSPKRSIGAQGKSQQNKGKRTRWEAHVNCTTLDVNTVVGCLFFTACSMLTKNIFFFSFSLLNAVQTTRASWLPSTSMICHREKLMSRDKTSQLGLLLMFEGWFVLS